LLLNIPAAWWTSSRRGLVQRNILQLNLEAKKTALCVLRPQFPTLSTTDTEEVAFCVHLFFFPYSTRTLAQQRGRHSVSRSEVHRSAAQKGPSAQRTGAAAKS
jgi:hypothetical protein